MTNKMDGNFFAVVNDGEVRKINLTQPIIPGIRDIFLEYGERLVNSEIEEIKFDGNYNIQEDEVLFVELTLPDNVKEVETNAIGIPDLDIDQEQIKSLFWYEDKSYYFQNFDNRRLLRNKNVLTFNKNTYSKLEENAFIVENMVNAVFKNEKFYFSSFINANKIFNLSAFYHEATNEEIKVFALNGKVVIDETWFTTNTNSVIRKQITLLQKSKILDAADTSKIKKFAKKFNLGIDLDTGGKIIFPNDKKVCKDILTFLNEQFYLGLITGNKYKTSSKRDA